MKKAFAKGDFTNRPPAAEAAARRGEKALLASFQLRRLTGNQRGNPKFLKSWFQSNPRRFAAA